MDNNIKIGFWNINGLTPEKTSDNVFKNEINKHDIIFLSETWQRGETNESIFVPEGFFRRAVPRKSRKKRGRPSGGIAVYFKKSLAKVVSVFDNSNESIIWIKLSKGFAHPQKPVFIAGVYNSPINSKYHKENKFQFFTDLENQLKMFQTTDMVIIGGDFNSRVSDMPDFIIENEKDLQYMPENYETDLVRSNRCNEDPTVNQFGKELINLCVSSKLRILNGRTRGDFQGKNTYFGYQGSSTVDLILTSEYTLSNTKLIQYMSVGDLNYLSDHKPITLSTKSVRSSECCIENAEFLTPIKDRFIWDENVKEAYIKQLDDESKKIFKTLKVSNSKTSINETLELFENLFLNTAEKTLRKKPNKDIFKNRKNKHKKDKPWFDNQCKDLRRKLRYITKSLNKDPYNPNFRGSYFNLKKQCKSTIRRARRQHEQAILHNLEYLNEKELKKFWKLLKQLRNANGKNNEQPPLKHKTLRELVVNR